MRRPILSRLPAPILLSVLVFPAAVLAQRTGQPASDVLLQFDVWGNPTFRGGVTNSGPNSHSVW